MTDTEDFQDLRDLYQEVVLDHGRKPRHVGRLAKFDATAFGDNPMCGDRVRVWVSLDDKIIGRVSFEARGCAISVASADLMADSVRGHTTEEARDMFAAFREMARTGTCPECEAKVRRALIALAPLSGVHEYPSRVKCATLPWHALIAAIDGRGEVSSE